MTPVKVTTVGEEITRIGAQRFPYGQVVDDDGREWDTVFEIPDDQGVGVHRPVADPADRLRKQAPSRHAAGIFKDGYIDLMKDGVTVGEGQWKQVVRGGTWVQE